MKTSWSKSKESGVLFSPKSCSDRTRVHTFKLNQGGFTFVRRRKYFRMRVEQNCNCFSREVDGPCQGCSRSRSFVPPETVKPLPSPRMEFLLCGFSDVLGDFSTLVRRMSAESQPGCCRGSDLTAITTAAMSLGLALPFPLSLSCLCRDEQFCHSYLVPRVLGPMASQSGSWSTSGFAEPSQK